MAPAVAFQPGLKPDLNPAAPYTCEYLPRIAHLAPQPMARGPAALPRNRPKESPT